MKKRLISLLLTLIMLVSLCTAFSASASADATVTTVTLGNGETVLSLCQKLGVDYYTHKNLIMTLNGFTSEGQFSKMAVGTKVVLPVSNAAAAALSGSGVSAGTVAGTTTGATAGTGTGIVSGSTTTIPTGDYVSYYLIGYKVQPGETLAGIYNNWGLSYKTYANQIVKLNNLSSVNVIRANQTLLLPTTNPAVAGSAYTTVMAHVMRSGDSAYNIICSDYGLNYNTVQKQVQALNNRENLANFMVGEILYIPITGMVSSSTTVTPGAGSAGSSSSSATVNNSAAYNIVCQTPVNGSFSLLVDGKAASTAFAGKTVEVVASPNAGYALSSISVTKVGDANTSVAVSGNKFVMPSYSVNVNVTFAQAVVSKINIDKTTNGGVSAMVNGMTVTSATAGNLVTIKTIPATGFMVDTIRVTYNNYRDTVAVENGQFTMPAFPVTVTASFKDDPNYDPNKGHSIYVDALHGKVVTKIGTDEVTHAKAGDRVSLSVTPDENYTVQSVAVYYDNFKKTVDIEKNAFTMPDGPVTVVATITPTANAEFGITKVANSDGTVKILVDNKEVSSAKVGAKVKVSGSSNKSFYNYIPTVFKTGDTSVTVPVAEDGTFTMPDFPVTVNVKFYLYHKIILDASNGTNGYFNVTSALNQMVVTKCGAGVQLKVTVWGFNKNTHAPGNVIITYADGSVHEVDGASFIMPDCDIKVRVNFNPVQKLIAHSVTEPTKAGNSYTVLGKTLKDTKNYTETVNAGERNTVIVTPNCAFGYQVDTITIKYTRAGESAETTENITLNPVTGKYQFEMPKLADKTQLHLYVKFREIATYAINIDPVDKSIGGVTASTSLGVVTSAVEGVKVNLLFTTKAGYAVDYPNIRVETVSGKEVELNRNDYSFFMPNEPVNVHVPFRSDMHTVTLALAEVSAVDGKHKGFINATVDGIKYTDDMLTSERKLPVSVKEGAIVTIINESREGFILDPTTPILVKRVNTGVPIQVNTIDEDRFSFEMPDDDVIVLAQYVDDMYTIVAAPSEHGTYTVPKQAAYSATVPVTVTNISPEEGFELDKILVSYTDHAGKVHSREPLANGTNFIPDGGGIPNSDVVFEVVFKPLLNPLTINYLFKQTPNSASNYSVDLTVDGKKVEGITRGEFTGENYSDVINVLDDAGEETGFGIPTKESVIISRQQHNLDKNFNIVNIWITLGDYAITPQFSNGQYFFEMPYVSTRDAETMQLNIEYAKQSADSFNLTAYAREGAIGSAVAKFEVEGVETTIAKPKQEIVLTLTPEDHIEIVDGEGAARLVYIDADNVQHGNLPEDLLEVSGNTITIDADVITSLPISKTVAIEYATTAKDYELSYSGDPAGGACSFIVDGNPVEVGDTVQWGKRVAAFPVKTGYAVSEVKVVFDSNKDGVIDENDTNNVIECNGNATTGWLFDMPKGIAEVQVKYGTASYPVEIEYDGSGKGSATLNVGETVYGHGDSVPFGSDIVLTPVPVAEEDCVCTAVTVNGSDSDVTKNEDGTYSFKMPATGAKIKVTFTKKSYELDHKFDTGSEQEVYTLKIGSKTYDQDEDTAKVFVGVPVSVIANPGWKLEKAVLSYKIADGKDHSETITSFGKDADGNPTVTMSKIPESKSTVVYLVLSFTDTRAQFTVTDATTGYTVEDITVLVNGKAPGGKVTEGTTVTLSFKVRSTAENPHELDDVTVTLTESGDVVKVGAPTKGSTDPDGMYVNYSFSFKMPKGDVTIDYSIL